MKDHPAQRPFQERFQFAQFRQQACRPAQPLRIELQDDVAAFDQFARLHRGDPIMRQAATDDCQIARPKLADVIANQNHTGGFSQQVDLVLRMEVPDIALPGIVVEPPQETVARLCDDVFEGRRRPWDGGRVLSAPELHSASLRIRDLSSHAVVQAIRSSPLPACEMHRGGGRRLVRAFRWLNLFPPSSLAFMSRFVQKLTQTPRDPKVLPFEMRLPAPCRRAVPGKSGTMSAIEAGARAPEIFGVRKSGRRWRSPGRWC